MHYLNRQSKSLRKATTEKIDNNFSNTMKIIDKGADPTRLNRVYAGPIYPT